MSSIQRAVLLALVATAGLCAAPLAAGEVDSQEPGIPAYQSLVAAGDYVAAVKTGQDVLSAMRADRHAPEAVSSIDERVAAVDALQVLTTRKLSMIYDGIVTGSPSVFRYTSPTPSELYVRAREYLAKTPLRREGLSDLETRFAQSYVQGTTIVADERVTEAYLKVVAARPDEESASKARGFLTAYFVGAHDDDSYSAVLPLLARKITGGKAPVFIVDDAVALLDSPEAAYRALRALEACAWAAWPESERHNAAKAVAEFAEKKGDYATAVRAYGEIAAGSDAARAQAGQSEIIRILGEKAVDYGGAAQACAEYLKRFPNSPEIGNIEYLKARFEYDGRDFHSAIADMDGFVQRRGDSPLVPSALLVKGLALAGLDKTGDAVAAFSEVIARFPKHDLAGKAQFLIGITYYAARDYSRAYEAFQKFVDFYPNNVYVPQAGRYMILSRRSAGSSEEQGAP